MFSIAFSYENKVLTMIYKGLCDPPSNPNLFYYSSLFTVPQELWSPCWSLKRFSRLLPQSLCICWPLSLNALRPRICLSLSLTSFRPLPNVTVFPYQLISNNNSFPLSLSVPLA